MTATLEDVSSETYDSWGTLNTAVSSAKLDKAHTPRAVNVWPDERPGSIVTVEGWAHVGDLPSGNPSRFLYTFEKSDGTAVVLCSDNGTVYKTVDFVTFSSIITGLSSAFQLRAITVRDKVWLTNGNDSVRTYDGTSVVVLDGSGGTTPNVPKGKFIELWHERVWIGDIQASRSSLRFSALVDSSGNDIAPDDVSAWPSSNEIQCGEDDGDVICGLKVYLTVLFPFKAKSIYRIDGQDEFTYSPRKTISNTGSRIQESIQERDNILEFIGKDGIYEFDGNNALKVSEPIESVDLNQFSFSNIQQSSNQQKSKLWSTASDFNAGTLTKVSSSRISGSIIADNYVYTGDALPASSDPAWTSAGWSSESTASGILSVACVSGQTMGHLGGGGEYHRDESTLSNTNGSRVSMSAKLTTSDTNDMLTLQIEDGTRLVKVLVSPTLITVQSAGATLFTYASTGTNYHTYDITLQGNNVELFVDGVSRGTSSSNTTSSTLNQRITFGMINQGSVGSPRTSTALFDFVSVIFVTTSGSQIISDVYHITDTISSWGAFQANYTNNSGSIAFYFRSGTTSGNCTGASWTAITPGATISVSTSNVYVQWRADLTLSGVNSPQLDDVTINWNTGSAGAATTQGVASIVFKQRYWLSGALTGSSYNDTVIVRGKRKYNTPFIRLGQFNLLAFCIFNDHLYAASSSSDDILKLDQDSSAAGSALDSYWETRDEVGGADEIFSKRFPIIIVTGQKKGNYSLTVDVSTDGGVTYPSANQKTISLAGSGRFETELRYRSLRGKMVRVRVRTNGIDQPFEVESIRIFWRKTLMR